MRIFLAAVFTIVAVLSAAGQASNAASAAPKESLAVFNEFFTYVYKDTGDLVTDLKRQDQWLAKSLKAEFRAYIKASGKPSENPDYPSNRFFVGAWEYPTSYKVVGSRAYGKRAMVDVKYDWGKGTNYEGDQRLMTFVLVLEDKAWKIDDIYSYRGEFASAESLSQLFRAGAEKN